MQNTIISSISAAAGQVMSGLDGLFTSDDERNSAKLEVEKAFNALNTTVLSHLDNQERERTDRHKADMQSDSWLSKNVRPLALVYLLGLFTVLALSDSITALDFDVADKYVTLLENLLLAVFGFYFVSRGVEKVAQAVKEMRQTNVHIK